MFFYSDILILQIYEKVGKPDRDDNIFGFMTKFRFQDTRAVFVGQDPSPNIPSSGFAFDSAVCQSTMNLILYINRELNILDMHCPDGPQLAIDSEEIENVLDTCSLNGLIQQS